jgi:hypothetical protein
MGNVFAPGIIETADRQGMKAMVSPRAHFVITALLCAVAAALSQQPNLSNPEQIDPKDALALAPDWLQHGDARQRAWAAYWIGRDRRGQEIPELIDALNKYETSPQAGSSDWTDDDLATLVMLDSMIQLKANVPPDLALALYSKFRVRALLLLARSDRDARDALLAVMDEAKSRTEWLAAADLLAENPPPGFAARLLKNISIQMTIFVLSPGVGAGGGGSASDCAGSTLSALRAEWPPVMTYWLWTNQAVGSELLVGGENPVYWQRKLNRDYAFAEQPPSDCGTPSNVSPADLSRDLIGQLLGEKKDDFALQLNPVVSLTWSSPQAYLNDATSFVLKQAEILHSAEDGLQTRGLLTDDEAAFNQPPLNVRLMDERDGDKVPLPDLLFADPAIHVMDGQATEAVN